MNKNELNEFVKALFDGESPCNTDELVDSIMTLLTKYSHRNSEHGVCMLLKTYFENKADLINLFRKSEFYVGDMRIKAPISIMRDNNNLYILSTLADLTKLGDKILTRVDKNGKTVIDYLKTGRKIVSVNEIKKFDSEFDLLKDKRELISGFRSDGTTVESANKKSEFCDYMKSSQIRSQFVQDESEFPEEMHIHKGQKTSRAVRKICEYYGLTTCKLKNGQEIPDKSFESAFAKYSDAVSCKGRSMVFYVSVNPLDYLTMSFGNSWASCHTIDKSNKRRMPNNYSGMYCGGTLSYMLDSTSIITFLHDNEPKDIVNAGKIYRCMFHFNIASRTMIQGRVYPQGNDGATDLYKVIRVRMQSILSECIGGEDAEKTWVLSSTRPFSADNIRSYGAHYRDYKNFRDCNISYIKGYEPDACEIKIGHDGICTYCGMAYTESERLSHAYCAIENN